MKYPIGIQDFRNIREGGYVYVDKTQDIFQVLQRGKYYFLSRPRRFGKSLLLSTMKELYSGSAALFEGLWIEQHWDFAARRRPVIWIKFAQLAYKQRGVTRVLIDEIDRIAAEFDTVLTGHSLQAKFSQLIKTLGQDKKVVLLIDEYDKPIIDFLDDLPQAERNRDELKSFYSVLKDSDPYLELVFITGVSAFSKVSIFSDLNNLSDLTLHPRANTLVGFTQAEIERTFREPLAAHDMAQVKAWYNGYRWGAETTSYNPFSLLSFLDAGVFQNYWFATGTPTFLVKLMVEQRLYNVRERQLPESSLLSFDFTRIDPLTVLFQTGYLTIKRVRREYGLYVLDYPNKEVYQSLHQLLLKLYLDYPTTAPLVRVATLRDALENNRMAEVVRTINTVFADLPYEHWQRPDEHFFHALIHLTFSLLGVFVRAEVHSGGGRCDAIVEVVRFIYAFEFKRDRSAAEALRQIEKNAYLAPYADSSKQRIAVGINFNSSTKQIDEWEVRTFG